MESETFFMRDDEGRFDWTCCLSVVRCLSFVLKTFFIFRHLAYFVLRTSY